MAGEGKGWISLYRALEDSWLWEDKPFVRGQAWIDLLLQANHKDRKTFSKGELVNIKRGSFLTSDQALADRWGWSRKKVRTFLDVLVEEQMVELERSPKGTSLSIVKWDLYQRGGTTEEQPKIQQKDNRRTTEEQRRVQQRNTNNNDNNYNNINNDNNSSGSTPNYIEFFNSNFHLINSYEINILNSFVKDGLSEEVILLALKKAVENNVRTIKYVKSILQSWLENNIKTAEGVKAEEEKFKRETEEKKTKYSNVERKDNGAKVDSFNGYQQRTYDGSDGGMTFDDLEKKLLGWK
ncbi:DnaD domain-containing protein [Clostridium tetani]|uniref:DnaD domain-containing protein n=1 Tax=Clostridium tetani TaxID=1513 RepID=UPI00100A6C13|nr:DnaD domain protein [Clostridium tetani]RXM72700.1 DnaD domain protein [Clostridium tetani]